MKYSDETIGAVIDDCGDFRSQFYTDESVVRMVLEALESTDEQKALRADAERWRDIRALACAEGSVLISTRGEFTPDDIDIFVDENIKEREA